MRKIVIYSFIAAIALCCLMPLTTNAQIWDINGSMQAKTTTSAPVTITRSLACDLLGSGLTITDSRTNPLCSPLCITCPFLHLRSFDGTNYTTRLIFDQNDNLGIGTDATQGRLHINGINESTIFVERNSGTWASTKVKIGISTNTGPAGLRFQVSSNTGSSYVDVLHLANNGKVGIGTTNPASTLTVNGDLLVTNTSGTGQTVIYSNGFIRARELSIDLASIPDYVFEKNYSLMKLDDLREYIDSAKHLPNIPSAPEYQKTGSIAVGELQLKLLEKIEELTLYTIQLNEENKELRKRIEALEVK